MEIRFGLPEPLSMRGSAFQGTLPDLVAPLLAAELPAGLVLTERTEILPPAGTVALTAVQPALPTTSALLIHRALDVDGPSLTLGSTWRLRTTDMDPVDALAEATGATRLLITPADPRGARGVIKRFDLPSADSAAVSVLAAWRGDDERAANKALGRLLKTTDVPGAVTLFQRYSTPGERRPWLALYDRSETTEDRFAVIDGLGEMGDQRLGWELATQLTTDPELGARTDALVRVARLQGDQPDQASDPAGHRAWRNPIELLEYTRKRAGTHELRVLPALATALMRGGRAMDAGELLQRPSTPLEIALRAEYGARTGAFGIPVRALVATALGMAPDDPDVIEATGHALARLGDRTGGIGQLILSAELANTDLHRWSSVSRAAAEYGDLAASHYASRRASDLAPTDAVAARQLQRSGMLVRSASDIRLGVKRLNGRTLYDDETDLGTLISRAPELELALLRFHESDVLGDANLLRRRMELHREAAMVQGSARDGALLKLRHRSNAGRDAITAGRTSQFWTADPSSGASPAARMHIQLATGQPVRPAGAGAAIWYTLRRNPEKLAEDAPTWPVGMTDAEFPPIDNYAVDKALGAVAGVTAQSSTRYQRSLLLTERAVGDLPPPLANLYDAGPTVLSTARGIRVVRLEGGPIPLFAAVTLFEGRDLIGLGLTPTSARDAVEQALGEVPTP